MIIRFNLLWLLLQYLDVTYPAVSHSCKWEHKVLHSTKCFAPLSCSDSRDESRPIPKEVYLAMVSLGTLQSCLKIRVEIAEGLSLVDLLSQRGLWYKKLVSWWCVSSNKGSMHAVHLEFFIIFIFAFLGKDANHWIGTWRKLYQKKRSIIGKTWQESWGLQMEKLIHAENAVIKSYKNSVKRMANQPRSEGSWWHWLE